MSGLKVASPGTHLRKEVSWKAKDWSRSSEQQVVSNGLYCFQLHGKHLVVLDGTGPWGVLLPE